MALKGPCCLLALRPNDHIALFSLQAFLQQSFSHSPSLTLHLGGSDCCSVLLQEEILLCGPSLDDQRCPLRAGCGSLFLQNPAEFRFLFFFPHLPSPFGNFRPAVRPNFTHSFSTKTLFCPRKCSNLSFYQDFFFPCDVEVYVSLKNPRPCF